MDGPNVAWYLVVAALSVSTRVVPIVTLTVTHGPGEG
jgi:hypothetical protein